MTKTPSLHEQISDKCRHFNGIQNKACKAGVEYDSFRPEGRVMALPCFREPPLKNAPCAECGFRDFLTDAEVDAEVEEIEASIRKFSEDLAAGKCPHCGDGGPRKQVGRCVYGACGHRLYQGKL
jgi:hypothetical protein